MIEKSFALLPANWATVVEDATQKAIETALDAALLTVDHDQTGSSYDLLHKAAVAVAGGVGGAFGLISLPLELPVSTTIILRSIATIARSEGETIRDPEVKLQCLAVLAMGGSGKTENATEISYFAVRSALAGAVTDATMHLAQKGLAQQGAPALVRLITAVAAYFSVTVSEKLAVQSLPVLGGVGGAILNTIFMDHFQMMARGHFTVRSLERTYGEEMVKNAYDGSQRPPAKPEA